MRAQHFTSALASSLVSNTAATGWCWSLVGSLCLALLFINGTISAAPPASDRYQKLRDELVDRDIVGAGVHDPRVLDAMRQTPRHEFVLAAQRKNAYFDMALPIGAGQTISPPYVVAFMTEKLEPRAEDRVLEIGTGSGYQAAVLSYLVQDVYSIEIVESLGQRAAKTLQNLKYTNVHTKIGDGFQGWAEHAPFDKIIVTCSPEQVPQPLIDQLVEGGRIVVPLGSRFEQTLYLFVKENGKLRRTALESTFFVPMTGAAETQRAEQVEERLPQVRHRSFEVKFGDTSQPEGWYYVRQAEVTEDAEAPDGQHVLKLSNTTPGRMSHVVQSFGVDGRYVRQMRAELMVRGTELASGNDAEEAACMMLEFYSATRAPVGRAHLGPWKESFGWRKESRVINVPAEARLAVLALGMFGGTGTICFDNIDVQPIQVIKDAEPAVGKPSNTESGETEVGTDDAARKNNS